MADKVDPGSRADLRNPLAERIRTRGFPAPRRGDLMNGREEKPAEAAWMPCPQVG